VSLPVAFSCLLQLVRQGVYNVHIETLEVRAVPDPIPCLNGRYLSIGRQIRRKAQKAF